MRRIAVPLLLFATMFLFTSCHRNGRQMWEDTKTAGRYVNKGVCSLLGRHEDSRLLAKRNMPLPSASASSDFIPLADDDRYMPGKMSDFPPSKESPGDPGSVIPGIDGFRDPQGKLAELFKLIHFELNKYDVKGEENIAILNTIAGYLNKNPTTFVFVEGHADERGSASFNLSLGAKRANSVRNFLIEQGVSPDQLFTISYGKERPISMGHDEGSWWENRRSAFKLYER